MGSRRESKDGTNQTNLNDTDENIPIESEEHQNENDENDLDVTHETEEDFRSNLQGTSTPKRKNNTNNEEDLRNNNQDSNASKSNKSPQCQRYQVSPEPEFCTTEICDQIYPRPESRPQPSSSTEPSGILTQRTIKLRHALAPGLDDVILNAIEFLMYFYEFYIKRYLGQPLGGGSQQPPEPPPQNSNPPRQTYQRSQRLSLTNQQSQRSPRPSSSQNSNPSRTNHSPQSNLNSSQQIQSSPSHRTQFQGEESSVPHPESTPVTPLGYRSQRSSLVPGTQQPSNHSQVSRTPTMAPRSLQHRSNPSASADNEERSQNPEDSILESDDELEAEEEAH